MRNFFFMMSFHNHFWQRAQCIFYELLRWNYDIMSVRALQRKSCSINRILSMGSIPLKPIEVNCIHFDRVLVTPFILE